LFAWWQLGYQREDRRPIRAYPQNCLLFEEGKARNSQVRTLIHMAEKPHSHWICNMALRLDLLLEMINHPSPTVAPVILAYTSYMQNTFTPSPNHH
jgi:hypothetical protein